MTGEEAAPRIPRGCLDFVYLDARHDYQSVYEDLTSWFARLRPGGLFAGHDYIDGVFVQGKFGLRYAVDDFFPVHQLRVRNTFADVPTRRWYVELPLS